MDYMISYTFVYLSLLEFVPLISLVHAIRYLALPLDVKVRSTTKCQEWDSDNIWERKRNLATNLSCKSFNH